MGVVSWIENITPNFHTEALTISFNFQTGELSFHGAIFVSVDNSKGTTWSCLGSFIGVGLSSIPDTCTGITVSPSEGSVSFSNSLLEDVDELATPITLNGKLTFPPF
jgi:hypothetical protein